MPWNYISEYEQEKVISQIVHNSSYLLQPLINKHCTVALYNPLTDHFEWSTVDCGQQLPVQLLVCFTGNAQGHASSTTADDTLLVYIRNNERELVYSFPDHFVFPTISSMRAYRNCSEKPVVFYRDGTISLSKENEQLLSHNLKYLTSRVCGSDPSLKYYDDPSNILTTYKIASEDNIIKGRTYLYSITRVNNTMELTDICLHNHINVHHWCISITTGFTLTHNLTNVTVNSDRKELVGRIKEFVQGVGKTSNPEVMLQYKAMKPRSHGCPTHTSQFTCDDAHCVSYTQVLDDHKDCPDGSDENTKNFPCLTDIYTARNDTDFALDCSTLYFACGGQAYIDWRYVCDGKGQCENGADEHDCPNIPIISAPLNVTYPGRYYCIDHDHYLCKTSGTCIPTYLVNDLIPDCSPPEDEPILSRELDTLIHVPDHSCITQGTLPCRPGHPRCFPLYALCVYDIDEYGHQRYCRNGAHLHNCESIGCPTKYKCPDSYCIPVKRVCDGVGDCPGLEDEMDCYNTSILCPGLFRCRSGSCLDQSEVCDGHADCDTGEDETDCRHLASCPDGCKCHDMAMFCENLIIETISLNLSGYVAIVFRANLISIPMFDGGENLLTISFSQERLRTVESNAFSDLSSLTRLSLSSNKIVSINILAFNGLINLQHLDLSANPTLRVIHHTAFEGLWKLKCIDLSFTGLIKLPVTLIQGLDSLERMDIQSGRLEEFNVVMFNNVSRSLLLNITLNSYLWKLINIKEYSVDKLTIISDNPINNH